MICLVNMGIFMSFLSFLLDMLDYRRVYSSSIPAVSHLNHHFPGFFPMILRISHDFPVISRGFDGSSARKPWPHDPSFTAVSLLMAGLFQAMLRQNDRARSYTQSEAQPRQLPSGELSHSELENHPIGKGWFNHYKWWFNGIYIMGI